MIDYVGEGKHIFMPHASCLQPHPPANAMLASVAGLVVTTTYCSEPVVIDMILCTDTSVEPCPIPKED